jgi:primosomal protein N'
MKIVTIIPLAKGAFRENLTYFTSKDIADGSVVSISLRNKKILGLVISSQDASATKGDIKNMRFNLKKIIEVKEQSIFKPEFLESVFAINKYFAGKVNDTVASLIPGILKEEYDTMAKIFFQDNPGANSPKDRPSLKAEKLLFQAPFVDRVSFYKTMIRGYFAEKKSVFMILPTEFDIENFREMLGKGIENFTFAIHSGFTKKKMVEKLEKIITCPHPVLILGTAPFLAFSRKDVGVMIAEHESSSVYKTLSRPYVDLRIFAEVFASKINAKFILGDSLLRFETIERKEKDNFGEVHPLTFRIDFDGEIKVLERKEKFKILMDESVEKIKNAIKNKKNVFIFSLRKGLATYTICKDCNHTVHCEKCLAPVVLYLSRDGKKRMFSCNRCKKEIAPETICANCGSWNLMPLGIGTDTVYEEIKKVFPKVKVFKLDKETVKGAKEAKKIIKEFEKGPAVLIGTEMAFFYLREKVPLSIIASFDSLWSIPNFKMGEKIIQIIISLISKTEDRIIIQTKNSQDPAILAITSENLLPFVREELEDRKTLDYPPFKRFIKITHWGGKNEAGETKATLRKIFQEYKPEIFGGFAAKVKGKYVTNALIKMDIKKWSLPSLSIDSDIDSNLLSKLLSLPPTFSVNVDPEDLL